MDIELARTFLAVAATGNFVTAAQRLHVTQSTVSARIQSLESQLGARLFQRGRNGAELTTAGKMIFRYGAQTSRARYCWIIASLPRTQVRRLFRYVKRQMGGLARD